MTIRGPAAPDFFLTLMIHYNATSLAGDVAGKKNNNRRTTGDDPGPSGSGFFLTLMIHYNATSLAGDVAGKKTVARKTV